VPAEAKARFELALIYDDMDRTSDAIEQLRIATGIWKDADPD